MHVKATENIIGNVRFNILIRKSFGFDNLSLLLHIHDSYQQLLIVSSYKLLNAI